MLLCLHKDSKGLFYSILLNGRFLQLQVLHWVSRNSLLRWVHAALQSPYFCPPDSHLDLSQRTPSAVVVSTLVNIFRWLSGTRIVSSQSEPQSELSPQELRLASALCVVADLKCICCCCRSRAVSHSIAFGLRTFYLNSKGGKTKVFYSSRSTITPTLTS